MSVPVKLLTCGIESINVNAQVNWLLGANSILDLLDYTIGTNLVNLPGLNDLEATITIILVVRWSRQRRADAGVDVGVVGEETFLGGMEEVCAVVDAGLLARGASEYLGLPGVAVSHQLRPLC